MANYSYIKKGASGSAVSELQKLLNQNGYALDVDGNFGTKTQAAVRDYQSKNNLTVDGIVGNETLSSLISGKKAPDNANANWLAGSSAMDGATAMLGQYTSGRPGAYQSGYAAQIQNVLNQIMNREGFSYDFNADPLYQQYADRFQQQGKMAMMDTMGQAAALTGGYGNSYAQTVGQQAYNSYLQGLNDVVPELRDAAYNMYQDEGNRMINQLDILQGLENADYARYRDSVADWYADRDYNLALQQAAQDQARWEAEFALAQSKASSGGSRSSGSSSNGKKTNTIISTAPGMGSKGTGNAYQTNETYIDWTELLSDASDSERKAILEGTTKDGKEMRDMLVSDLGQTALATYRRKYGYR